MKFRLVVKLQGDEEEQEPGSFYFILPPGCVITDKLYISELVLVAAVTPGRLIDPRRRQTRQ